MDEQDWLAERFEENRTHLRAVAYRMLGSPGEADDAVQESWLRLSRSGTDGVENLGGFLTTVVARVCLDMLRALVGRGARNHWAGTCPSRRWAAPTGPTPSTRRYWPTRSVPPCW
jgi:DNA-directed RNA polymerase specialized sigma24 family protein